MYKDTIYHLPTYIKNITVKKFNDFKTRYVFNYEFYGK